MAETPYGWMLIEQAIKTIIMMMKPISFSTMFKPGLIGFFSCLDLLSDMIVNGTCCLASNFAICILWRVCMFVLVR